MVRFKKQGFSTIAVIVLAVLLGIIGLGVWRVWEVNNNDATQSTNQNTSQSSTPEPEEDGYFRIKELGIKIKLSEEIEDLVYNPKTLSDGTTAAYFSTESLSQESNQSCNAANGPLGAINKTRNKIGYYITINGKMLSVLSGVHGAPCLINENNLKVSSGELFTTRS